MAARAPILRLLALFPIAAAFSPSSLRVDFLPSPAGVEATPRFSWTYFDQSGGPLPRGLNVTQHAVTVREVVGKKGLPGPVVWATGPLPGGGGPVPLPYGYTASPSVPPSPLLSSTTYNVTVDAWLDAAGPSSSTSSLFSTGLLGGEADWAGAAWIAGPSGENLLRTSVQLPAGRTVVQALVHYSGLGYVEFFCNGAQVGGNLRRRDVAWTAYQKRVKYVSADVTACLAAAAQQPGGQEEVVLGASLGASWFLERGWYASPPYPWPSACNGGGFSFDSAPLLRLRLHAVLDDGSSFDVVTSGAGGGAWLASAGPVVFDSLYDGETYNATLEQDGWSSPGFDPASAPRPWVPAVAPPPASLPVANATMSSQLVEPIAVVGELQPVASWSLSPSAVAFDFGREIVGVLRVRLPAGPAGTRVTLRHSETLTHPPDGPASNLLDFTSLRNAHATDVYIMRGDPDGEVYEPHFTVHGFRYASVDGSPGPLAEDSVTALLVHNAVEQTGSGSFASPVLTLVQAALTASIVTNLQSGPGSCGARDERQFFTGDTALGVEASVLNFGLGALYSQWLTVAYDQQNADGSVGYYAPAPITDGRDGSPNWMTGFPTAAWTLHRYTADLLGPSVALGVGGGAADSCATSPLGRYIAFLDGKFVASGSSLATFWAVGPTEWVNLGPSPNASLVNAFSYLHDLFMVGDLATAVGADPTFGCTCCGAYGANLTARATALLPLFHAAFFSPSTSTYGVGTQTEAAMALFLGAPPDAATDAAVTAALVQDILVANGGHLTTGILGTRYVFESLARRGRSDVGLAVLLNTSYPGFGWMVAGADNPEPATTLWEEWDAYRESGIMASRNHLMFSSVGVFLLQRLGGLLPLAPGYATALVAPQVVDDPDLPFASAQVTTPFGPLRVAWETYNASGGGGGGGGGRVLCGEEDEADEPAINTVDLACGPGGGTIASVAFASFGLPAGSCSADGLSGNFSVSPTCNAPTSVSVVTAACVGQPSCSIPVSDSTFGPDPCAGVKKSLAAVVTCSSPPPPPPPPSNTSFLSISLNTTVPAGMTNATVALPLLSPAASTSTVVVTEGATVVWVNGSFVPGGAEGVVWGGLLPASISPVPALGFVVLSGTYAFVIGPPPQG
jgi:alpha-L-rhamnosidase